MMESLSPGLAYRIAVLFPVSHWESVAQLLANYFGPASPFAETVCRGEIDRVGFAVLKISEGSQDRLRNAIEIALVNRRRVLTDAGFAARA